MGKSSSGKTSMRSIIFSNYIARDTRRLGATSTLSVPFSLLVAKSRAHFHICQIRTEPHSTGLQSTSSIRTCVSWAICQEAFMENYFASQRDHIFRNVEVLIYVFDVESREIEKDMHYYQSCLEAILTNSKDAKIFCLVHKMDLVQEEKRDQEGSSMFGDVVRQDVARSSKLAVKENIIEPSLQLSHLTERIARQIDHDMASHPC
ncbi:Gtr1/RagA G protein conserved region-domain-containing protein [Jimgerdemannia flammicorona]|uniref:GTP-binding protein n=1 Tax=Jimgerdemannia flammicorona TaxID=994334 RepID=A0A433CZP0_9FUNG|nr:Gtr1/RagA G protein conserved region-domain-containing protein [Jimgerdemannia flammicorona]